SKSQKKLIFNRNLGNLLAQLETQRRLVQQWQADADRVSERVLTETYECTLIRGVIFNMYAVIRAYQRVAPTLPKSAYNSQLSVVRTFLKDMPSIAFPNHECELDTPPLSPK
ncbi:hypothetical protein Ciccas_014411, partial [Cichlidogyrus casuarinus]